MSEQYKPNIGEIPDDLARRDAIHIAVAPLTTMQDLKPGQIFGLAANGQAIAVPADSHLQIGVADPFRTDVIRTGTRFWGFLFPNTITNLRHVWEHPAFRTKPPGV